MSCKTALGAKLRRYIQAFRLAQGGNVAITFGLALFPMVASVGFAVDYSNANKVRTWLQAAADAASIGSIAKSSTAMATAATMSQDGTVTAGQTDAVKVFNAQLIGKIGFTVNTMTATVTKSNGTVTSNVQFNASVPTKFMGMMGKNTITVTGTSIAANSLPTYIDFYLLLDNSPSMGVGATPADVATMVANTPDQCAFACHDLNDNHNYYDLAKSLGVTTRIDVLRSATQSLMDTAKQTAASATQFRMAIYHFGNSASTAGLTTIFSLSSNLTSAKTAAGNIDLMTVQGQNQNNDMDTNFDSIFPAINSAISNPGSGATSAAPQKVLFFVSDGVADENNSTTCTRPLSGSNRCQEPLTPSLCTTIKNRGIKIAVLYTTYLALPTNSWYNSWIAPFNQGPYGPSVNSLIAQNMQSCASPGLYFEVSPTQGISNAMNALFQKTVSEAHLTQ